MTARTPVLGAATRTAVSRLTLSSDVELGVELLRGVPTNEHRSDEELAAHSSRATAYGIALAERHRDQDPADVEVVDVTGGLRERVVARYDSRHHRVRVYTDTVAFCEALVDELGWRDLYPVGSVRRAAIEHERAHHLVTADRSRGLREALDQTVLRIGRWRRLAFIAGTDELAAHAFSTRVLGVPRSMLLVTAAATAVLSAGDLAGAAAATTSSDHGAPTDTTPSEI